MKNTASLLAAGALLAGCASAKDSDRPDDHPEAKQSYSKTHGVNFGVPPKWKGREKEWKAAGSPPFNPGDIPADFGK